MNLLKYKSLAIWYRVFIKYCVFSKNSRLLLVVQKNHQPIGVTVHSHCAESFECSYSDDVGDGWVAVNCEKKHSFS